MAAGALGACSTAKKNYQAEPPAGAPVGTPASALAGPQRGCDAALHDAARQVEARTGARLGLAVLDSGSGRSVAWRPDERFALCSTFKTLLAAQTLYRIAEGQEVLQRRVHYSRADLVEYSPVTTEWADSLEGMSLQSLMAASVVVSDNTAANLLLQANGGPAALTHWLRATVGDAHTRLDRREPELNSAEPGDERDTTTPAAMAATLRTLLLEDSVLPAPERTRLTRWLVQSRTGDRRVRAGLPPQWAVGGKTGSGAHGTTNDTLIIWPGQLQAPLLVACYLTGTTAPLAQREQALAQLGGAIAQWQASTAGNWGNAPAPAEVR